MVFNKIILSCAVLAFTSSLYASDADKQVAAFAQGANKLEKAAAKEFKECKKDAGCVEKTYANFKKDREKLVKKKLNAKPANFNKKGKKTLAAEEKCITKNPAQAKKCFKKNDAGIIEAASAVGK